MPDKNESFCRAHNKFISGELLFSLGVLMGENRLVYMDHAATTFIKQEVVETMLPFLKDHFGNPSSLYSIGREGKEAVETAREKLAKALGASPEEIYFTSGGGRSLTTGLLKELLLPGEKRETYYHHTNRTPRRALPLQVS